ncbi:conserved hypothetical protein [Ricinus communis]|uniref:DUF4283 domain-containing protein n=1 Tax=Ricinus communis TaxID=3988 RepID=B9S6K5_RICCO|nr:conserved hypothetical protein [Ricinus communis]
MNEESVKIFLHEIQNKENEIRVCMYLVRKILSSKPMNCDAIHRTFSSVWRLHRGYTVKEWGDNIFVFQFFHERNKIKVIKGNPWMFDNHPILLHEMTINEVPNEIQFSSIHVWIRLYNLPWRRMNVETARVLGA